MADEDGGGSTSVVVDVFIPGEADGTAFRDSFFGALADALRTRDLGHLAVGVGRCGSGYLTSARVAFGPGGFLENGRLILGKAPGSEAAARTVCGRAYYAVYGSMRIRLRRAKGVSADHLFGRAVRHSD